MIRPGTLTTLFLLAASLVLSAVGPASAAVGDGYPDGPDVQRRLAEAADRSGGTIGVSELGRTSDETRLFVARIGTGDPTAPATLLVAGLDGRHLHGVELALRHVEAFSADPESVQVLLDGGTLYVVPTLLPEATDAVRALPRRARATSPGSADHDRDGLRDEDRGDDLDGDGVLRSVRLADRGGPYRSEPERPGILRVADGTKGESGAWRLLSEGRDDDGDERWNEEEDGGVLLSRNFPFGYEWFARNRGLHQVSEPESRALLDFLVQHPEIGTVLVYGFEDNLLQAWPEQKSSDPPLTGSRWGRRPLDAPNKNDLPYFRELSNRYLEAVGLDQAKGGLGFGGFVTEILAEDELAVPDAAEASEGGFAAFAYYHRGLVAVSTPVWTPGVQLARLRAAEEEAKKAQAKVKGSGGDGSKDPGGRDESAAGSKTAEIGMSGDSGKSATSDVPDASTKNDPSGSEGLDSPKSEKSNGKDTDEDEGPELPSAIEDEARFLDWLLEIEPSAWKEWEPIAHPDFPGRVTEVGGYAPLARVVPPFALVSELFDGHHAFLVELIRSRPRVGLRSLVLRRVEGDVYELEIEADNTGYLPDLLAHGVYASVLRPTRFELSLPAGAEVLGGTTRGPLERLAGSGGGVRATRLLRIPDAGTVDVRIVSEHGGRVSRRIAAGDTWRRP